MMRNLKSFDNLRQVIRYSITENTSYKTVRLTDGSVCEYGDEDHITDMEGLVRGIETLRDQYRRTSAARSVYAAAAKQLKQEIKKLRAKKQITELEPGEPMKPRPGFDGGLTTEPGHGRYEPGND